MATTDAFESTLKEVVQAKRLSASKMSTLTDIALKCMEQDTQLVSILYRTHKSLSTSAKVPSLYAFDALARAARSQVNKHNLTADTSSERGNCATFLLKVEGVLDGLFQDMVSSGSSEAKEKAKKILDIWVKSNTFPSAVLSRLSKVLKGAADKEPNKKSATADPRLQTTPPTSTTPPHPPPVTTPVTLPTTTDIQSTLLALLNQAASAVASTSNGQTTSNTAATLASLAHAAPVMNANQFAVYQQLTQSTNMGSVAPSQPMSLPVSLVPSSAPPPVVPPPGGPSQPHRYDHYGSGHRESNHNRYDAPGHPRDRNDYHDDRRDFRGGFRGDYRGRGRGRWDDRSRYNDRGRDRERTPPSRGRRSRSRSPPSRFGDRRDMKAHSPSRRPPALQTQRGRFPADTNSPVAPEAGKDEFGRDLRAASPPKDIDSISASRPVAVTGSESPLTPLSASATTSDHGTSSQSQPPAQQLPPAEVVSSSEVVATPAKSAPSTTAPQGGLDTLDLSIFDPASPASWEALGKAWAVTHGYLPSQMELMEFTISNGLMGGLPVTSQFGTQQAGQWPGNDHSWVEPYQHQPSQASRGTWLGGGNFNGRGRGRGGHGHGNSRNMDYMAARDYDERGTDAQVLASGDESPGKYDAGFDKTSAWSYPTQNGDVHGDIAQGYDGLAEGGQNGEEETGRMQRVGDKWVFVRADA